MDAGKPAEIKRLYVKVIVLVNSKARLPTDEIWCMCINARHIH